MNDEDIILDTLKFINRETQNGIPYINICTTLYYSFDANKQSHFKTLLFTRGFVNQNPNNPWEFQLTAQGFLAIETLNGKLEREFLKYLKKQSDIKPFMVSHFIKPDPGSLLTKFETDSGVTFLKALKYAGKIDYQDSDLNHVSNDWYEDDPPTKKRWFDTLHEPMLVTLLKTQRATRLHLKNPKTEPKTPKRLVTHIGTCIVSIFKKISIVTIIEMIIAGLIVGALIYLWHLNKVRI